MVSFYKVTAYLMYMRCDWVVVGTNIADMEAETVPERTHRHAGKFHYFTRCFTDKERAAEWARYFHETRAKEPFDNPVPEGNQLYLF